MRLFLAPAFPGFFPSALVRIQRPLEAALFSAVFSFRAEVTFFESALPDCLAFDLASDEDDALTMIGVDLFLVKAAYRGII